MISWLRRHSAPFAAVLVIFFTGQMFDLFLCADEARERGHDHGSEVASVPAGSSAAQHPVPDHGPQDEASAIPDCLCHFVFTRTDIAPAVTAAPAAQRVAFSPFPSSPDDVDSDPLDHVPLA